MVVDELAQSGPHPQGVRPPRLDAHHLVAGAPGEGTGAVDERRGRGFRRQLGGKRRARGSFVVEGEARAGAASGVS